MTSKSKKDKKTVELGLVYSCKAGGSYVPVRIDKAAGKGRYQGMCMTDGKPVKVHAKDIRGSGQTCKDWHISHQKAGADDGKDKAQEALKSAAKVAAKVLGTPVGVVPSSKRGKRSSSGGADRPTKAVEKKRPSGLDAAVTVLAEAKRPMTAGEMVARMLEVGLWKTKGKTPAATIYTAVTMLRNLAA
jgi:hypothetical protein